MFENSDIVWGMDLASEHERYLCEVVFKKPVALMNYPKDIKVSASSYGVGPCVGMTKSFLPGLLTESRPASQSWRLNEAPSISN